MKKIPSESKYAIVTGASSGIGATFAKELATKGYNLILIARRKEKLENLANILSQEFKVDVEVLQADLSNIEMIEEVVNRLKQVEGIEVLVNNAGFGLLGKFADIELSKQLDMINVHSIASFSLTRAVIPEMIKNNKGFIINVASVSGLMYKSGNIAYSVTKSFLIVFSEALQEELRNSNIKIQALCPGMTITEFHDKDKLPDFDKSVVPNSFWMTSESVVRKSLRALKRRKTVYIPSFKYKMVVWLYNGFIIGGITNFIVNKVLRTKK